jgi:hypothetical protein
VKGTMHVQCPDCRAFILVHFHRRRGHITITHAMVHFCPQRFDMREQYLGSVTLRKIAEYK